MATGASTADLAVLLVSAADGLTGQTRRHALIVSTLGVRHFVVVINKNGPCRLVAIPLHSD
jgi:sulfate adenylyltransferase subunit 1 (EFTu-like GTPase family)